MVDMIQALLVDADGVAILAPEPFSRAYAREQGLDEAPFEQFFMTDFREAVAGRADLYKLLAKRSDVWGKHDDIPAFARRWFDAENVPNLALVAEIKRLRETGLKVYLATNQEPHRAEYLRTVMFPGVFDGMIVSCEVGATKPSHEYFEAAYEHVADEIAGIARDQIAFIDDSAKNVAAATEFGFVGELFRDVEQLDGLVGRPKA